MVDCIFDFRIINFVTMDSVNSVAVVSKLVKYAAFLHVLRIWALNCQHLTQRRQDKQDTTILPSNIKSL